MTIWCVRGRSVAILNDIVRLGHAVTIISRAASAVYGDGVSRAAA